MMFHYFDDVCESVNLTTVYSAIPQLWREKFGTNFSRPMRPLDTNQRNNVDLRMLVKIDSGEEGCHE